MDPSEIGVQEGKREKGDQERSYLIGTVESWVWASWDPLRFKAASFSYEYFCEFFVSFPAETLRL